VPLALAGAAVATPWLFAKAPEVGLMMQRAFSLVCHQQPERSFYLFGGAVAVCARCLGIYLGAAVGLLFRMRGELAWRMFVAALAANALDWLAEVAGLHGNLLSLRFALGVWLGLTAAALVASAALRPSLVNSREARA